MSAWVNAAAFLACLNAGFLESGRFMRWFLLGVAVLNGVVFIGRIAGAGL
jgi:hypothetical protein